ncbi:serine O-acetyltransferase [Desulfatibacillum aliphaticivorans]|uniref:serine O-acetyltransferase n=1 Tax=Desulfatibacillum aliphaticivorans TaxID=218208 RepID=UPI0004258A71|nr:serine O-acetyltransferase [Desulfatibacillum aliphaticivorans]
MEQEVDFDLVGKVYQRIGDLLDQHLPKTYRPTIGLTDNDTSIILSSTIDFVMSDLEALTRRDPAAKGDSVFVLDTYKSFEAVMNYRLANNLINSELIGKQLRLKYANKIQEESKVATQIDINPSAQIGKGFIIDHGIGTVIGETCEIGENCYFLNGIVLGATGIADNESGRRHPKIGKDVSIASFARLLGPISVGDRVTINSFCVITSDIPNDCKVSIVNQLQVSSHKSFEIYGIVPATNGNFCIYGSGFPDDVDVSILNIHCDDTGCFIIEKYPLVNIEITDKKNGVIKCQLSLSSENMDKKEIAKDISMNKNRYHLALSHAEEYAYITPPLALIRTIETLN